ncbi:drug/metabolite transporter (DMT)-like permease [Neobacillus sp. B4I6]
MKSKIQFILSMIIFGTIGLVVRYIDLSSSERALLSSFIGCLFLLLIFFMIKKKISWNLVKSNALFLILSGIALGGNWIFLYQSYDHTTIANATLGYYFAPVFVMILSPFVLREQLSIKKIVCIGVAIIGMLMIVGEGVSASKSDDILGLSFGLIAAAFYAALLLLNKFIKDMEKLELTIIQLGTTTLLLMPYVFLTSGFGIFEVSSSSIPFILILRDHQYRDWILVIFLWYGKIKRTEYSYAKLFRSICSYIDFCNFPARTNDNCSNAWWCIAIRLYIC